MSNSFIERYEKFLRDERLAIAAIEGADIVDSAKEFLREALHCYALTWSERREKHAAESETLRKYPKAYQNFTKADAEKLAEKMAKRKLLPGGWLYMPREQSHAVWLECEHIRDRLLEEFCLEYGYSPDRAKRKARAMGCWST